MTGRTYRVTNLDGLQRRVSALAGPGKLVGFDVFDTLLRRRMLPERVKDVVAQRVASWISSPSRLFDWKALRRERFDLEALMCNENVDRGCDTEFCHTEMLRRWLTPHGFGNEELCRLCSQIEQLELDLERRATLPNRGIASVLHAAKLTGARLVFVSDFYLSVERIWELLSHHGLAHYFEGGYCSSSSGMLKKSSGRLHRLVMQLEGIDSASYVFVGDNEHSDVSAVARQGGTAIHLIDKAERRRHRRLNLLENLTGRNPFWAGAQAREILERFPVSGLQPGSTCPHYKLGMLVAPIYTLFVERLLDEVQARGIERVYFLAREGLLFQRMYSRLARARGMKHSPARAYYLCASRRATFLASMNELSLEELERIWRQYPNQSISRLCRNLSLPLESFAALAREAGFEDLDKPIVTLRGDERVERFIRNREVIARFMHFRDRARDLLHRYLEQKGFFEASKVAVVDIGWKGSIQDFLVRSVPSQKKRPFVHGFYFALSRDSLETSPRSTKTGLIVDTARHDHIANVIFENGPLFEMTATANHGTTAGYEERGSRGKIHPILERHGLEIEKYDRYFSRVHRAVREWFLNYCALRPLLGDVTGEMIPYWLDELRRYIRHPSVEEIRAFLEYGHMESFGVFEASTFGYTRASRLRTLWKTRGRLLQTIFHDAQRHFWPPVVIRAFGIPFATSLNELQRLRVIPAPPRLPGEP